MLKDKGDLIDEKMKKSCFKWFGHVQRRVRMPMRKSGFIQVEGSKERKKIEKDKK